MPPSVRLFYFCLLTICGMPPAIAQSASNNQTWVDNSGGLLHLDGGIVDGAMVLRGESIAADASSKPTLQRITWTPQSDGRVRQLWESSSDSGETWSVVFDGIYSERP